MEAQEAENKMWNFTWSFRDEFWYSQLFLHLIFSPRKKAKHIWNFTFFLETFYEISWSTNGNVSLFCETHICFRNIFVSIWNFLKLPWNFTKNRKQWSFPSLATTRIEENSASCGDSEVLVEKNNHLLFQKNIFLSSFFHAALAPKSEIWRGAKIW